MILGTRAGEYVSMAVVSDGSYGVPEGLVFSFPVTCSNGEYTIVQGLLSKIKKSLWVDFSDFFFFIINSL